MTETQLYLISPLDVGGTFPQRLERALAAGKGLVTAFQFRVKGVDSHEAAALANGTGIDMAALQNDWNQIVDEAKDAARTEGAKLVADAKAQIDQEVLRAKESLREQVASLAVSGAEKILRKEIDAAKHADLLASIKAEF